MFEALTSYIEARSKLVERRGSRGFWPIKGKNKSGKGKGKSFGKKSKDREALLQGIARSHCRKCGALGHWKAECLLASNAEKSGPANVVFAERPQEVLLSATDGDEVFSENEYRMPSTEVSLQTDMPVESCFMLCHPDLRSSHISSLSHRMSKLNHRLSTVNGFRSQMPIPCRPFASLRKRRDSEKTCHAQPQAENQRANIRAGVQ